MTRFTTHDELSAGIADLSSTLERSRFTDAFVASLSTRDLAARDAFGHYAVLQNYSAHAYVPYSNSTECRICGAKPTLDVPDDFEGAPGIAGKAADALARFASRPTPSPTDEDRAILARVFDAIRALPPRAGLDDLQKSLIRLFKSNKWERVSLLESLGYAGILCPIDCESYHDAFVSDRTAYGHYRPGTRSDWSYPTRMWRGGDGIVEERLDLYFGHYL